MTPEIFRKRIAEAVRAVDGADWPDDEMRFARTVACAVLGHPPIIDSCFGYVHCARCREQIGDTLAGSYRAPDSVVVVGHDCDTCRTNAAALSYDDRLLLPDDVRAAIFPRTETPDA